MLFRSRFGYRMNMTTVVVAAAGVGTTVTLSVTIVGSITATLIIVRSTVDRRATTIIPVTIIHRDGATNN